MKAVEKVPPHTKKRQVMTQKESSQLQAKKGGLRKNQACQHFDPGLPTSKLWEINFSGWSHPVCGVSLWEPQQTKAVTIAMDIIIILHLTETTSQNKELNWFFHSNRIICDYFREQG